MYNSQLIQEITHLKSWDQKVDHYLNMSPLLREGAEHYKAFGVSTMSRLEAISDFEWKSKNSIKSHTILLRANGVRLNTDKDYGLSKVGVLYLEQGIPHFIVRLPMFNGCCYCGCCLHY
jgi:predicted GNAT family N-acyltransferase